METGSSSLAEVGKNLVLTDQKELNAIYGEDVEAAMAITSTAQAGGVIAEALGAGKVAKAGIKSAEKGIDIGISKSLDKLATENLARGTTIKLGKEDYHYLGEGIFEGPNKGRIVNTGQVDSVTGNTIYQRMNKDGGLRNEFYMLSSDGKQITVHKPESLRVTGELSANVELKRPYIREETKKQILSNYTELPNGDYMDSKGKIIKGPIDIGHVPGWEHRRLILAAEELKWTQTQLNDYVNARPEKFRLENRSENRSHKDEIPGKNKLNDILDDMKIFEKTGK